MGVRENLQKLADKKTQEISELEHQIELARTYLQAIQDSIRAIPRESQVLNSGDERPAGELRPGSLIARARDVIQKNGKPMRVEDILEEMGMENSREVRASLVGSLGGYVRKGSVFTRPAPNTFGLAEMKLILGPENVQQGILPVDFGLALGKEE